MFLGFLFILLPLAIAFLIICLLWPNDRSIRSDFLVKSHLSIGLGLGISSCNFFIWLVVFGSPGSNLIGTEIVLFISLLFIALYLNKYRNTNNYHKENTELITKPATYRLLFICFIVALIFMALFFIFRSLNQPHGFWDAWAIWNMRARFLFRAGEQYASAFSNYLHWSHPDYPLLLPCNVARVWGYMGYESILAPILIAFLFTFTTVGLIVSSLSHLQTRTQGLLAGLVLLSISFYIKKGGPYQVADVPIGFFFLATIVLFCYYHWELERNLRFIFLAGVMAGFGCWTKNEGLLFFSSVLLARFVVTFFSANLRTYMKELVVFLAGSLPILFIIILFKTQLAPPSDLISGQGFDETIRRLGDLHRYLTVGKSYFYEFYHILKLRLILFLFCIVVFWGYSSNKQNKKGIYSSLLILCFQLLGYFMVYIITPHDIDWHLKTSLLRLFIQLLPSAIFIFFLFVSTPDEVMDKKDGLFLKISTIISRKCSKSHEKSEQTRLEAKAHN